MRVFLSLVCVLAPVIGLGCDRFSYRPKTPSQLAGSMRRLSTEVSNVSLYARQSGRVAVDLRVEPAQAAEDVATGTSAASLRRTDLSRAWLASAGMEPCHDGILVESVQVDGEVASAPISLTDARHVRLEFDRRKAWQGPLASGAFLYVQTVGDEAACLSTALSELEGGWEPAQAWSLGIGARWRSALEPIDGVEPIYTAYMDGARWLGPVRLSVEFGAGQGRQGVVLISMALAAQVTAWQGEHFALAVGPGYETILAAPADSTAGEGAQWIHGPRVALHFAFTWPRQLKPGFPAGLRAGGMGIELPISYWTTDSDRGGSFVLGLALTGQVGM